ncbi:MAG TPA: 50S ribosomal protein L10 [Deltaproteobacteria bacterium]|nr:50S ribosomal protein L10 [Deltaproteobacteria bacterium]HQI81359.1 50S ribosomal protein L10 [Deltaproteobacteria bacterium]
MKREEKEQVVQVLHDELGKSQAVFVTDYMGLTVERITKLRRDVSGAGGSYQVVKNTLLRRASEGTPAKGIEEFFVGPTAIAIAKTDAVAVAKALVNFAKDNEKFEIQAGMLGERVITAADIQELAKMPAREVLLARMLGSLNAPVTNFVGVLAAIVTQLVYVLKAIETKKSQGE